jgi:hypothetical protein
VDEASLAWAKRKMREIVAEAKERKRGHTRKREARWETSGRSAPNIPAKTTPSPSPPQPTAPTITEGATLSNLTEQVPAYLANLKLQFTPEELEAEGWRTSRL